MSPGILQTVDFNKINEQRTAEKRAEFLFEATLRMSERREHSAMSLLLAAIDVYRADYRAVRTTLENWITNRQLPHDFAVPDNAEEFREMCLNKYGIKS